MIHEILKIRIPRESTCGQVSQDLKLGTDLQKNMMDSVITMTDSREYLEIFDQLVLCNREELGNFREHVK